VSAFGAGQRPGLAAAQASGGAGRYRRVTLRAKFLAAVIADIRIVRKFGKAGRAFHSSPWQRFRPRRFCWSLESCTEWDHDLLHRIAWRKVKPPRSSRPSHSSTKRVSVDKPPQADILSRAASQPLQTNGVSFHSAPNRTGPWPAAAGAAR